MEIVFVELAHKTGEVAVLEVLWEDSLGKFLALGGVPVSYTVRPHYTTGAFTSRTTKLSPSSPQRTMDA